MPATPVSRLGSRQDAVLEQVSREEAPIPQVFNGAVFSKVDVPSSVAAGQTLVITGVVGFDCPICVVDRNVRVVAEFDGETRTQEVGGLSGRGETQPFNFSIPAPLQAGATVTLRLKAQHQTPATGTWHTDNTEGPFTVNVVSQSEQTVNQALAFTPWAAGGGLAGVGVAHLTERNRAAGAVAGVGAGVVGKVAADQFEGGLAPEFPLVPVVATAALLGAGAIFLSVSGAGGLGRAASRAATRATG